HPDERFLFTFAHEIMWLVPAFGDAIMDDVPPVAERNECFRNGEPGRAVLQRLLNDVGIIFRMFQSCDFSVVGNADEKMAAAGVRERNHLPDNLVGGSGFPLEFKRFTFAPGNKLFEIANLPRLKGNCFVRPGHCIQNLPPIASSSSSSSSSSCPGR